MDDSDWFTLWMLLIDLPVICLDIEIVVWMTAWQGAQLLSDWSVVM